MRNLTIIASAALICGTFYLTFANNQVSAPADLDGLVGERVETWVMENPEILIASLTQYQSQQEAAQQAIESQAMQERISEAEDRLFNTGHSLEMGNPSGDVTIVLFSDYNCPHCATAQGIVKEVIAQDPGLRLVLREYPILGESSVVAARFALAVKLLEGRDKAIEVHDALFAVSGQIKESDLESVSANLGMSYPDIRDRMQSEDVNEMIKDNLDLGSTLDLRGTPNFVFANGAVAGALPAASLLEITAMQRAAK